MSKGTKKPANPAAAALTGYGPLLAEIKARVMAARVKAGLAANRELLALYWDIGRLILERQKREGWGAKVIERLSRDLQRAFPGQQGFSRANLLFMRAFAAAWAGAPIVLQPVRQLSARRASEPAVAQRTQAAPAPLPAALPEPIASLPWGHNLLLLHKLERPEDRLWYAIKAVEHGWSRNVLALQIDSGLHQRQGKGVTNFQATLPPAQSDLAQGITKDPYVTKLVESLPQPLRGIVPSVAEIEKGLTPETP